MTNSELNRDIKRLVNQAEKVRVSFSNQSDFRSCFTSEYDKLYTEFKKEFIRLYNVDKSLNSWNLQSFRIMLRLNLSYRFIDLKYFGNGIEL